MEQLSLIDFNNLCDQILNGEKSIQDQFDVYNNRRDILNKMSFLNHLLSYKNIHKNNLLEILYKIYLMFQKKVHDLSSNDTIRKMIQRNNSEWYVDGLEMNIKDPIYSDFFNVENPPARACVEVSSLPKGVSIDIECVAFLD